MGRFFACLMLSLLLLPAPRSHVQGVQPVFFSMLFPQLIPPCLLCEPAAQPSGWAVTL